MALIITIVMSDCGSVAVLLYRFTVHSVASGADDKRQSQNPDQHYISDLHEDISLHSEHSDTPGGPKDADDDAFVEIYSFDASTTRYTSATTSRSDATIHTHYGIRLHKTANPDNEG